MSRTLNVKGPWKGVTVTRPSSSIGDKVVGLSSTGGLIKERDVVCSAGEAGLGSTVILGLEV